MADQLILRQVGSQLVASHAQIHLLELLGSLAVARKNFDQPGAAHGRTAVYQALFAVIKYVEDTIPERPDFVRPLRELLYALRDLDRGTVAALLEPQPIKHRPHMPYSEELLRADAAVLMHFKIKAGSERKVAAGFVARRLNERGYRHGNNRISGDQVIAWRNSVKASRSKKVGSLRYRDALRRLELAFPNEPGGALAFYLSIISNLNRPDSKKA
jgi:hypothetical protein